MLQDDIRCMTAMELTSIGENFQVVHVSACLLVLSENGRVPHSYYSIIVRNVRYTSAHILVTVISPERVACTLLSWKLFGQNLKTKRERERQYMYTAEPVVIYNDCFRY